MVNYSQRPSDSVCSARHILKGILIPTYFIHCLGEPVIEFIIFICEVLQYHEHIFKTTPEERYVYARKYVDNHQGAMQLWSGPQIILRGKAKVVQANEYVPSPQVAVQRLNHTLYVRSVVR